MGQGEGWVKMGAEIRVRPKVSSNHQSEGRGLDRFCSEPQKEPPYYHLELGLLASRTETINFCCTSHPVCGALIWQP